MKQSISKPIKKEELKSQLRTFVFDFQKLSSKKPNDNVNVFKLQFVNELLLKCNAYFGDSKPFATFESFNVEELPTNSDVLLILNSYMSKINL